MSRPTLRGEALTAETMGLIGYVDVRLRDLRSGKTARLVRS